MFQVLSNIQSEYDTEISTVQPDLEVAMNISKVRYQTPLDDFPNDLFTGSKTTQNDFIRV